jgi:putative aminopeptidase FrvX
MVNSLVESYKRVETLFADDSAYKIFERIANTHAPSQTVKYTRAVVINDIIKEFNLENSNFDLDFHGTGNSIFRMSNRDPKIIIMAHADQISYFVDQEEQENVWRIIPFCKHLSSIQVEAVGLRYDLQSDDYKQVSTGHIFSKNQNDETAPYYWVDSGDVQTGDRIVYNAPAHYQDGFVQGITDNAAGVTACLLAAKALFKSFPNSNVGFVFTDEEEGPATVPAFFARGARRLFKQIDKPDLCIVVDGHGGQDLKMLGSGASFAEKTGGGLATLTPPDLFVKTKLLAKEMQKQGVQVFENHGSVSRGDDVACLEITGNVISVGYPTVNRHFNEGYPRVSITDLVNLAKTIYWMAAFFENYDR